MLDDKMKGVLDHLINRTIFSFHTVMSSIQTDKVEFHIVNESDYALGLTHGMILTGFVSEFKNQHKREPNQEEMTEVSEVLFERTDELREAILKSNR
jgi:hypothetical protein